MERKDVDPTKYLNEPPSRIIAFHGELKLSRARKRRTKGSSERKSCKTLLIVLVILISAVSRNQISSLETRIRNLLLDERLTITHLPPHHLIHTPMPRPPRVAHIPHPDLPPLPIIDLKHHRPIPLIIPIIRVFAPLHKLLQALQCTSQDPERQTPDAVHGVDFKAGGGGGVGEPVVVAAVGLVDGAVGVGGQPGGELGDGLGEGAGDGTVVREGWGGEGADGEEGVGYGGGGAPEVGHPGLVGAGGGEGVRWGGEDGGGEGDANRSSIVSG